MKQLRINNFDDELYYHKLDNGLEIYLLKTPNKNSYNGYLGTKFGGSYTSYDIDGKTYQILPGTAHFLEHKLLEQEDEESVFDFYSKSGTNVNAGTGEIFTYYYFNGCDDFVDNLKFLISYVNSPYITDKNVAKEKGIILEEAKMNYDDPDFILYNGILNNLFHVDDAKTSIVGSIESISSITKEALLECYNAFYNPSNMFLVVTGDFDHKEVLKVIEQEYQKIKKDNKKFKINIPNEPDSIVKDYEKVYMDTKNDKFAIGFKINKEHINMNLYEYKKYVSLMLESNFGVGSSFREEMRNKKLYDYFSAFAIEGDKHTVILFMGESKKSDKFIQKIIDKVKNLTFDKLEFERIKKTWIAYIIRSSENAESIIDSIVDDVVKYGEYKNNTIDDIKKLKYEEMEELYKKMTWNNKSIMMVSSKKMHK